MRHLWCHLNARHHTLLLELMKAFKLLRPLADTETFLVPAMLPRQQLPDEYVTPHWWRPAKASNTAIMHISDEAHRAEMRIMYKVLGGRLPFGFMSELQVRLAQSECIDQDEELHFAPEFSVVERVSGSVLSVAYTCGGGTVREWTILSQAHTGEAAAGDASNSLRIMGWAEVSTLQGATDWRLFRGVIRAIEGMAQRAPCLSLRKMALYADASGKLAKPIEITRRNEARQVFLFEFEDGSKIDVCRNIVLPSIQETKLSKPQPLALQPAVLEGTRHGVDAFFAKRVDDHQIDVHAEGQLMMREIMNPVNAGAKWDCHVNPQPTLHDLRCSIASCRQRNVRVLHLAGHGRKECGFIWNASDDATQSQEFDVEAISLAIGMAAGTNGPVECAVLNACSTWKMGLLLRTHNVPYVICWRTSVLDETAKEVCQRFYRALVENVSGVRDYKRAFYAATDGLRSSAHTGGASKMPRGAMDLDDSHSNSLSSDHIHSSSTRSDSPREGGSSLRGSEPWHQQDVVLFLSKDGDSEPIYLWRKRPALPSSDIPSALVVLELAAEKPVNAVLKALFEQHGLGALCVDVCQELGVVEVGDLSEIDKEMLDDLPKYLKDQLKPLQKKRFLAMIASQSFILAAA